MAKGFTTHRNINGKEPLLLRMVCEVRYSDGQLYLDHTGRLLKKLCSDPAWIYLSDPSPKGTALMHLVHGMQLSFAIGAASIDLNRELTGDKIDVDEAKAFSNQANSLIGFVMDELEISNVDRIGLRTWHHFNCDSIEDSENWMAGLKLICINEPFLSSFGPVCEAMGLAFILKSETKKYRIAINGKEQSAQLPVGDATIKFRASTLRSEQDKKLKEALKQERQRQINSAYFVELDIDTYDESIDELDVQGFIDDCINNNLELFRKSINHK